MNKMTSNSSSPRIFRTDSTSHLHSGNNGTNSGRGGGMCGGGGDKTVCEYCGVSYLTMSEMRALQTKVMDQEDRLNHLKDLAGDNSRMKETLANIRKSHRKEIQKRDEECQRWVIRCTNVENELEAVKRDLKKSQGRNSDLAQKYAIASEDFKQQEELICQLRSKLQSEGDTEAENIQLKNKNRSLEENLQKLLQEIKSLRTPQPANANAKTHEGFSIIETALKAKVAELTDRCNRLTAENNLYQEEIVALLQSPEKQAQQASLSTPSPREASKPPSKMPSVVTVEVHDLKRENAILSSRLQSVTDEHSSCQDMHAFLRESIEKLKADNVSLLDEMNGVKVKYEESLLKVENFQAVISGYQAERNRFMVSYKEQQNKLEQLAAQNRAFHKACDPKMAEQLRSQINSLERQIQVVQGEKDRQQLEFEGKVAEVQREVTMEKERADSCLTQSLAEREDVEKRWQERWARHHNKLVDQLEILKTNYDGSLKCAKEREECLQREIHSLQEKLEKTQKAWDEYKIRMNEQLYQWKIKYEELEEELQNTVKCKVDVEVMFQEKTQQLEELHEAVRQGCEERQDLQRRTEELERSIQEAAFTAASASATSNSLSFPPLDSNAVSNTFVPESSCSSTVGGGGCAASSESSSVSGNNHHSHCSSTTAAASTWKQSHSFSGKIANPQQQHSQQQQQASSPQKNLGDYVPSARQRPNSPFPLLGGKSSAQTFTVGMGKTTKTNQSLTNFKEKINSSSNKSLNKSPGAVVFSVAPPNVSRKSHRN